MLQHGDTSRRVVRALRSGGWIVAAAACLSPRPSAGAEPASTRHPNVILISLCSLRPDHLGCYGYHRDTSPAIDGLAKDAVIFEQAETPWPKTAPSFCSVMTGLFPYQTGVMRTTPNQQIDDAVVTLAERLKKAGYRTGGFVTAGAISAETHINQGFDVYEGLYRDRATQATAPKKALEWLRQARGGPCLLWVHFNNVHYRYAPAEEFKNKFVDDKYYDASRKIRLNDKDLPIPLPRGHPAPLPVRRPDMGGVHPIAQLQERPTELDFYIARYDATIRTADEQIGTLLAGIRDILKDEPTIVALWSDHGESLGEHNYYFEHGRFAYESCTRVAFMIRYPQKWKSGQRVREPVTTMDLAPTLMELTGAASDGLSGMSLTGVIDGTKRRGDLFLSGGYHPDFITGIRRGHMKLLRIANPLDQSMMRGRTHELYDLSADPSEMHDLSQTRPELVKELDQALTAWTSPWWDKAVGQAAREPIKYDPAVRKNLQELGYLPPDDATPSGAAGSRPGASKSP